MPDLLGKSEQDLFTKATRPGNEGAVGGLGRPQIRLCVCAGVDAAFGGCATQPWKSAARRGHGFLILEVESD